MSTATQTHTEHDIDHPSIKRLMGDYLTKVRGGDVGALPAILGLVTLVIVFTAASPGIFLTAFNFANLINQGAAVIVIAMGLIFVLLLGEIDLSAGFAAGTSGAILAVVLTNQGLPWYVAVLACLITGSIIGLAIGWLVAKLGIPSFVVTLAGFLGLQGLMLLIISEGGTIPVRDPLLLGIMNNQMPIWAGWALGIGTVLTYALVTGRALSARRKAGLPTVPQTLWLIKTVVLAFLVLGTIAVLSVERSRNAALVSIKGVPYVVPLILALLVGLTFVLNRTAFGRHIYAVGGNAEAARRSGIKVLRIRISCFVINSMLAATAGILFVSRDNSVSPSTGGSTTLLFAVGAAVIGGTSLFGGRGKVRDAILGGLVVAVIANGMALLNQPSGIVFVVTGLVLLVAASVDALSRKRAQATGRA